MGDVAKICAPRLGLLPDLTMLIFELIGISAERLQLFPLDHSNYGTLTNGTTSQGCGIFSEWKGASTCYKLTHKETNTH